MIMKIVGRCHESIYGLTSSINPKLRINSHEIRNFLKNSAGFLYVFILSFFFTFYCIKTDFKNLCDPNSGTYASAILIRLALGINSPPCVVGQSSASPSVIAEDKEITSYSIPSLGLTGIISGNQISLSSDTLTGLTPLVANFETTGISDSVSGVEQTSGVSVNSYSSNLIYKVTAANGTSQEYTVTLTAPRIYGGSSLRIWLKSDSLALNDGDPVATWNDLSGFGNSLPQSIVSARPTYRTNQINNLPSIQFRQANSERLELITSGTGLYVTNSGTFFVVMKWILTNGIGSSIFNIHGTDGREMVLTHPNGIYQQCRNNLGCYNISGEPIPQNEYIAIGSVQILTTSNSEFWNGDFKGNVTVGLYDFSGGQDVGNAFISNGLLDADIAELLYFNTNLSQNEIDKVFCYLRLKYKLTSINQSCGL
ncbi:hypothetical protein [Leptospira sp. GIMC2001]|uniref:hypothetical protein n=1 Tax=Leptospira sp. GIMC2001 TaxID=1513297 RepID=UPI002349750F|nr:hypothetical protein [Leptospira sp. GIMC2001]WCL50339.1 hypothetical protein O4O04_05850 [Leptospira sp. GIMC2001]